MATPDRDPLYGNDTNRTVYTREGNGTAWFIGIIVVLALLAIGYLVFSANSGSAPSSTVNTNNAPAVTTPAPDTSTTPSVEAPATPATPAPSNEAAPPADNAAPATPPADNTTPAPAAPAQ
jgi:hypothetical protein